MEFEMTDAQKALDNINAIIDNSVRTIGNGDGYFCIALKDATNLNECIETIRTALHRTEKVEDCNSADPFYCSTEHWKNLADDSIDEYGKLADQHKSLKDKTQGLVKALEGIEIKDFTDRPEKCLWLLLRSDGKKVGAGSVRLDGDFAKAFSEYGKQREEALAQFNNTCCKSCKDGNPKGSNSGAGGGC